jgi:ABC-type multidrug transport system fused ATPase/permease subunit
VSTAVPPTARPVGYRDLLRTYLAPQRRRVLLLALLLGTTIGLQLANPRVLRLFIDDAATGAPLAALLRVAVLFLGVALALQLAQLGEVYVAENVGLTATNRLRAELTLHVLRLDPSFHASHSPGELIERTDGDVTTLGNFFARLIVHLVGNTLLLLGALALLFAIDLRVGAAVGLFTAIAVVVMVALRRVAIPRFAALRQANAELFGLIEERLGGTEDLRANGGVAHTLQRLAERSRAVVFAGVAAMLTGGAGFNLVMLSLGFGTVAALGTAAYLYRQGELTIGTVYLIFAYADGLRRPLEGITRQLQDLQQAVASVGRVRALLAQRSTIVDGLAPAALPPGPLSLELDRVRFAYGEADPVLRDLSFRLGPGQVLGLLGRTGSGKTTIARLLFRLHDPTAGSIKLGGAASSTEGVDLRDCAVAALRARIGIVTQDVQLFHATVRDNVTLFDRAVGDPAVEAVLRDVGLGPWLDNQPTGLDAVLAPGGGSLSAGEAQLLAFARVFLKDPGLVVLDEASSRLDPATERLLERAVDRLLAGRTAIVIAHRLATVARADRILILEDGRAAEEGDRATLAADPTSRFARLLRVGRGAREVLA